MASPRNDHAAPYFAGAEKHSRQLAKQYQKAYVSIEKDMEAFYARYASEEGLTLAAAKQKLNKTEVAKLETDLGKYMKGNVTRLQGLQAQIGQQIEALNQYHQTTTGDFLAGAFKDSYYHGLYEIQTGMKLGTSFSLLPEKAVWESVKAPWSGKSYSQRIWENQRDLKKSLTDVITQGMIRGEGIDKMARHLRERFDVATGNAKRLIMTETAHVVSESTRQSYNESGVEKYEYMAEVDRHTSEICMYLDGQIFPLKDYEIGLNAPPMHPNCRSTTIAYFEDIHADRLAEMSPERNMYTIPDDIPYQQWFDEFSGGELKLKADIRDGKWPTDLKMTLDKETGEIRHPDIWKHMAGTEEFSAYTKQLEAAGESFRPSYFLSGITDRDIQDTIKARAGTGKILPRREGRKIKRNDPPREVLDIGTTVGKAWDAELGGYVDTSFVTVVYSKEGTHAYPMIHKGQ